MQPTQRFTSWAEIEKKIEGGPTLAEQKLKEAVILGKICHLADGNLPVEPEGWSDVDPDRHIRAEVLRYFLVAAGEEGSSTEFGVGIDGALISGNLWLVDCTITANLMLRNCRFEMQITAPRTRWKKNFRIANCFLPSLVLSDSKMDKQLELNHSTFLSKTAGTGLCINLQRSVIAQDCLLSDIKAHGHIDLNGADVGGRVDLRFVRTCTNGPTKIVLDRASIGEDLLMSHISVSGDTTLGGARIGGNLNLEHAEFGALILQQTKVGEGLILRKNFKVFGDLMVVASEVGDLVDEMECWPDSGNLILDGFTYRRLHGATDARSRLKWLAQGDTWQGQFFPQPYKQLAKVLHDMGREADAREVKIELERKLSQQFRRNQLRREPIETSNNVRLGTAIASLLMAINFCWDTILDWFYRNMLGYGYKPLLTIKWVVALILLCWIPSHLAWQTGGFAPNSAVMLQHSDWNTLPLEGNAADIWANETPTGRDWESFNSLAFAADVVIPIIEFGQTDAWAPSKTRGWWGYHLWWARWVFTTLGWIATALGAAALTGIIRRE